MPIPPVKKSIGEQIETIMALTEKLGRQTHAGVVMIVAAALDRLLEEALTTKMVTLNREIRDKLFGDYGTLRGFSAKIDIAFSLGLLDGETRNILTAVRKCRNLFAHTNELLSFESLEVRNILAPSTTQSTVVNSIEDFISIAEVIESHVLKAVGIPLKETISKLKADI